MPIEFNEPKQTSTTKKSASSLFAGLARKKFSTRDRMFFTEQLILLLETGGSLHEALSALQTQFENPAMEALVVSICDDINSGKSFSFALAKHEQLFSSTYINLVAASEAGGFIVPVLKELLEMDEKKEQLQSTLVSALSYPVFLIFFSFAVVIFVLLVVFPKFSELFESIQDQLPATTIFLMAASNLLANYWIPLLAGLGMAFFAFTSWSKSQAGKLRLDNFKLSFPVVKGIYVKLYMVQSLRVMSLSLKNGVSILDTIQACREIINNSRFQKFMDELEEGVMSGAGVAVGFANSKFVPDIVKHMVNTGEQSGNLALVMARIADYYDKELTKRVQALSKLAEPVMLLVMGVVVGVIVSSLILPIFKLSRAVN